MMDGKSKENLKKILAEISANEPAGRTGRRTPRHQHLKEYHFESADELIRHVLSRKRVYRGDGERGWIGLDIYDRNKVVSYQRLNGTGRMGVTFETLETFIKYAETLDSNKVGGYIDFWHKKQ